MFSRRGTSDKRLRRLVDAGTPLVGATAANVASTAVGAALGDPIAGAALGGAAGAAISTALKKAGVEIEQRLNSRERIRVGAVWALGAVAVQERLDQGDAVRTDGFFDFREQGRSDADEVFESVLLKSQREPEERKLPHMAQLLANVAFEDQISAEMAHQLVKAAEQLTYRQLCILELISSKEFYELSDTDYQDGEEDTVRLSIELTQILHELFDLCQRAYVGSEMGTVLGVPHIAPNSLILQGLGGALHILMRLDLIPERDLEPIACELK